MLFTVLLVDDHPVVRNAYRQQIETWNEEARVICCGCLADAFRHLDVMKDTDLALLELNLPDASGVATIGAFRNRAPIVPVAALSGDIDPGLIQACRAAGASGFISKTYTHEQLHIVLRQLQAGLNAFPDYSGRYPEPAGGPLDAIRLPRRADAPSRPGPAGGAPGRLGPAAFEPTRRAPPSGPVRQLTYADGRHLGLTDRQRSVLRLMLQGLPNKAICRQLDLAEGTVKVHVSAVLRALGVSTRAQAVVAAMRFGIRMD